MIEEKIRTYIMKELMHDHAQMELKRDVSLIDGGIIDSLGLFKLVSFIEEEFRITVEPHEVRTDNFETLAVVTDLVRKKLDQRSAGP
ncbi:MAG: acyl carrier protein [Nitrospirae bacterium]|nr:acyl carrier protein [Nitrospirota bacterium]